MRIFLGGCAFFLCGLSLPFLGAYAQETPEAHVEAPRLCVLTPQNIGDYFYLELKWPKRKGDAIEGIVRLKPPLHSVVLNPDALVYGASDIAMEVPGVSQWTFLLTQSGCSHPSPPVYKTFADGDTLSLAQLTRDLARALRDFLRQYPGLNASDLACKLNLEVSLGEFFSPEMGEGLAGHKFLLEKFSLPQDWLEMEGIGGSAVERKVRENEKILDTLKRINELSKNHSTQSRVNELVKEVVDSFQDPLLLAKAMVMAEMLAFPGKGETRTADDPFYGFEYSGFGALKGMKNHPNFLTALLVIDDAIAKEAGPSELFAEVLLDAKGIPGGLKYDKLLQRVKSIQAMYDMQAKAMEAAAQN